jgi:hypothetical protein
MKKCKILKLLLLVVSLIGVLIFGCTQGNGDNVGTAATSSPVPQNFRVSARTNVSITLAWNMVSKATKYYIYVYKGTSGSASDSVSSASSDLSSSSDSSSSAMTSDGYELLTLADGITVNSYVDSSLAANTSRSYIVSAWVDGTEYRSSVLSTYTLLATPVMTAFSGSIGLTIYTSDSSSCAFKWNSCTGATKYEIYRSDASNATLFSKVGTISESSAVSSCCYFQDSDLTLGLTYYYKVKALNLNTESDYSSLCTVIPSAGIITGLQITNNKISEIDLMWYANINVSGYYLYYSTSETGNYALLKRISGVGNSTYAHTSLNPGSNYYYKIASYIANASYPDNQSYDTVGTLTDVVEGVTLPYAPVGAASSSGLISGTSTSTATLKYAQSSSSGYNGTGVKIYRAITLSSSSSSTGYSFPYSGTATAANNTVVWSSNNSLTDSPLDQNTTYYYAIASYKSYTTDSGKYVVNFIKDSSGNIRYFKSRTLPPTPTGLSYTLTDNSMKFYWTNPGDLNTTGLTYSYIIDYSRDSKSTWTSYTELAKSDVTIGTSKTSYTKSNLSPGSYYFRIKNKVAYKDMEDTSTTLYSTSESALFNTSSISVNLPPISDLSASYSQCTKVVLTWSPITAGGDTITYEVYRNLEGSTLVTSSPTLNSTSGKYEVTDTLGVDSASVLGKTYTYTVIATDTSVTPVVTTSAVSGNVVAVLTAPTISALTYDTCSTINLSWGAVTAYNTTVYYAIYNSTDGTSYSYLDSTQNAYLAISHVPDSSKFYYKVLAYIGSSTYTSGSMFGESAYSTASSVVNCIVKTPTFGTCSAGASLSKKANLSWTTVSGADKYVITIASGTGNMSTTTEGTISSNVLTITDNTVVSCVIVMDTATTYTFNIIAYKGTYTSATSTSSSVVVK